VLWWALHYSKEGKKPKKSGEEQVTLRVSEREEKREGVSERDGKSVRVGAKLP